VRKVATIGVYGFDIAGFLGALRAADLARVLDVRQRRGVRGSEYAWANSKRLQAALADAGIEYEHQGVGKRSRSLLAPEYVERYTREILDQVDLAEVAARLPAALMCVERDPEACHRSLVAERLASEHGVAVVDLRP
jgi:uncharacterized protein (DUF488 family)